MCREFKERQCTEKRAVVGEGKTQVVLARLGNTMMSLLQGTRQSPGHEPIPALNQKGGEGGWNTPFGNQPPLI